MGGIRSSFLSRNLPLSCEVDGAGYTTPGMRRFATFVAILLLLVTVSSALACVTDRAMSH
jgi:hypothetical protein